MEAVLLLGLLAVGGLACWLVATQTEMRLQADQTSGRLERLALDVARLERLFESGGEPTVAPGPAGASAVRAAARTNVAAAAPPSPVTRSSTPLFPFELHHGFEIVRPAHADRMGRAIDVLHRMLALNRRLERELFESPRCLAVGLERINVLDHFTVAGCN